MPVFLSDQELEDLRKACDVATRSVNIFSEQFSRWCALEKRLDGERRRRSSNGG
jgi:hypothetical protein